MSCRFLVLPSCIGPAIIGKKGSHVHAVQDRTGARLEVAREQEGGSGSGYLQDAGSPLGLAHGELAGCAAA